MMRRKSRAASSLFMTRTVLPRLARLRSERLGQLGKIVLPPPRVALWDGAPILARQDDLQSSLCLLPHNDLSLQNVLIDPTPYEVLRSHGLRVFGPLSTGFWKRRCGGCRAMRSELTRGMG